jgi:DNA-binding LytR/AlgR family response regulator
VLLDISMPVQDGVTLARSLVDKPETGVVFVTAYDQFAAQAFDVDAVDYLLKPVGQERLRTALARARRRKTLLESGAPAPAPPAGGDGPGVEQPGHVTSLWVQKRQGLARIDIDTIEWIEAARDYVLLHTLTHSYILRTTMDGLARKLDPDVMIRVSRSAFVRRDAVTAMERQGRTGLILVLTDQAAVRVGTTFIKSVETRFGQRA